MLGFMGEYNNNIDTKGRLVIPAKFREGLGERFVVTRGQDHCLYVYSEENWAKIEEKMRSSFTSASQNNRKIERNLMAVTTVCEPDNLGRIIIPQNLRELADLVGKQEVAVLGMRTRVEIWNKAIWDEYNIIDEELLAECDNLDIFDI